MDSAPTWRVFGWSRSELDIFWVIELRVEEIPRVFNSNLKRFHKIELQIEEISGERHPNWKDFVWLKRCWGISFQIWVIEIQVEEISNDLIQSWRDVYVFRFNFKRFRMKWLEIKKKIPSDLTTNWKNKSMDSAPNWRHFRWSSSELERFLGISLQVEEIPESVRRRTEMHIQMHRNFHAQAASKT